MRPDGILPSVRVASRERACGATVARRCRPHTPTVRLRTESNTYSESRLAWRRRGAMPKVAKSRPQAGDGGWDPEPLSQSPKRYDHVAAGGEHEHVLGRQMVNFRLGRK